MVLVLGRNDVIGFSLHLFSVFYQSQWMVLPQVSTVVCEDYLKGALMPFFFPLIIMEVQAG